MRIDIPEDQWLPCGSTEDPRSRLLAPPGTLNVCGCPMHIEAYALKDDENDVQTFADPWFDDEDTAFYRLTGPTAVRTIWIGDREYALVATPNGV